MFNRFKSALLSSVGAAESAAAVAQAAVTDGAEAAGGPAARPAKFAYGRPAFLQLETEDELQVAGDRVIRPIIVPRDSSRLPWTAGYAEAVNAGKSKRNEDAAAVYTGVLHQPPPGGPAGDGDGDGLQRTGRSVPYYYFGLFDGHAGHGASVAAAHQLHHIIHERLVDVLDHLLPPDPSAAEAAPAPGVRAASLWIPAEEVAPEKLVTGALEAAFNDMDALIAEDRLKYDMRGGCTAVVALLLLGRLYVANAGDSRATYCRHGRAVIASHDFTPETERHRVRQLACQQPALTGGEFTHLDFARRVGRRDLGKRVLYRDAHMTGWAYKTVTERDLRFPIVCGDGKRSRVCATIGVTRGFGDHDLKAQNTNVNIKPFLSSQPQVLVVDLEEEAVTESDVLVMATDGLWDVISNERAAELVEQSLAAFPADDVTKRRYRCTSAAQDLVMSARGKLKERLWRLSDGTMATIDDISVFVVPMLPYREEHLLWKLGQEASAVRCAPAEPPSGVRQVSEPAQLDRYQSLVEQCGRPSPPAGTSPSGNSSGAATAAAAAAAEDPVETGVEPEFADAETGEPTAANGPVPAANGPSGTPSAAEQVGTVPVTWFGGEDATPVRRPAPR
ncbi:protein phosphatase 1H-like isoform X2 [Amphibalanus amphitrite]|uniref:protein phosphatase 1H-like isoform X1 n=1 Tax=Amphibalanus amphitrite TaxID=1232801 RepID=UPI001C909AAD|nr:protein phosphatase 1H-like isoform X1 [Amphibalanus amphitrite]XP_043219000.1 protein phosphatase 1H-like isoform X1 [Amphibalanus amphitrite]XP_043219001.1 protein phosphatase 1H-like isoform X1 [Amphibalanus amphitrite]XP_043219002.1 protein phosphatase 1H-like isoform X1 [Amphibalanus amphitrite]XP_043219003.1 protein phosphatase 1H-like isoform X1 [Amphibalanus amphitrite]XP_043219004.1 protein phosphatase 1H-like isoform X2 [Amphibalanus amphitrite]